MFSYLFHSSGKADLILEKLSLSATRAAAARRFTKAPPYTVIASIVLKSFSVFIVKIAYQKELCSQAVFII